MAEVLRFTARAAFSGLHWLPENHHDTSNLVATARCLRSSSTNVYSVLRRKGSGVRNFFSTASQYLSRVADIKTAWKSVAKLGLEVTYCSGNCQSW